MPSLDEAQTALESRLTGTPPNQSIDLVAAATDQRLEGLVEPLTLLRAGSRFLVSSAALERPSGVVKLTGSGNFGPFGPDAPAPVAVTLTVTSGGSGLEFAVALTVTAPGWKFEDSFGTLPHTLRQTTDGLDFGESVLKALQVDSPTFTARNGNGARVRMSGSLQPSGDLNGYRAWITGWPLALEGTVSLPAGPGEPLELDLEAVAAHDRVSLERLSLANLGFAIYAGPDQTAPPETPPFSQLRLIGTVTIEGNDPIVAQLSAVLLASDTDWRLLAVFPEGADPVKGGLAQLARLLDLDPGELMVPTSLGGLGSFGLREVEAWIEGSRSQGLATTKVRTLAAKIASSKKWEPPIPFLTISGVGARWVVSFLPVGGTLLSGTVFGKFELAGGIVDVSAQIPSFVIEGEQQNDSPINIGAAFAQLLEHDVPPLGSGYPTITGLSIYADPSAQVFEAAAEVNFNWEIPFFAGLTITQLGFEVASTQSSLSGAVSGLIQLKTPPPEGGLVPTLMLRAAAPGGVDGGWVFSAELDPTVPLTFKELLEIFHVSVPGLQAVQIDRLGGRIDTKEDHWALWGALSAGWKLTLFDTELDVAVGVEFELAKKAQALPELEAASTAGEASGWVAGRFSVNRFALKVRADVGVEQPTYALELQFGGVWLRAVTSWVQEEGEATPHQVVAIQLGGVTLGDILEEIVNLAAPTLGFSLEPPWDVLKRIDLSSFTLTIDPKKKKVALTYAVHADLVLMRVDTIGVSYTMGGSSKVDLIVTGRLLDQTFGGDHPPLQWDVVNDPPPAVPGKGPKLLELRYLGLGQRVRLSEQPETVLEAIEKLREDMEEPKPGENPLNHSRMVFDSSSEWLIGLDLGVLETVQVALVFNDPRLYGLSIGLEGERAGALAGLRFEVLYKQLAPGLGMFRIELQIPETYRHIELGEVSVTLGLVVLEIYTNGNFLIDLGFPHDRDYQRSFAVEVFPFVGRGGIYFGVLNGMTSRRVPAITNGTFSPVLELGVGLAVGVGKEVSLGPLSGGAYLELEASFQGVLAWFHPTGSDEASERYHWAKAMVALHGKVWGEVDFAVVKASVTLEAYAQASVVFESYRATQIELQVRVEARARIKILFISLSFSFSVNLDLAFTLGSDEPTPWALAASQPAELQTLRSPRRLASHQRSRLLLATGSGWDWEGACPEPETPQPLEVWMLPTFSVADAQVSWTGGPPPAPPNPHWRVALPLFAGSGSDTPGLPEPAKPLIRALLLWALGAIPGFSGGTVSAGQLEQLAAELAKDYVAEKVFNRAGVEDFFKKSFTLKIGGEHPPEGAGSEALVLPPPPWLKIELSTGESSDLYAERKIGPHYQRGASAYMAAFSPVTEPPVANPVDDPAEYESFATHAFCDWCLMVAREAVRQARQALTETTVAMRADLRSTAAQLPTDTLPYVVRPEDTIEGVANWLGAGVAELEELNPGLTEELARTPPGTTLNVKVGITGHTLAVDNASLTLASGLTIRVKEATVQVRAGETLDQLAARAGEASAASLLASAELAPSTRLLRSEAPFEVPERTNMGSDLAQLAARGWVRYFADVGVPDTGWYAQAVAEANQEALKAVAPGKPIPAGTILNVPPGVGEKPTDAYECRIGDTLLTIGATLSLTHQPGGYANPRWQEFRAAVKADAGGTLPAREVRVLPGESLDALAERLLVSGGGAALLPWLHDKPVLAPLAVIELPSLPIGSDHKTLADVAAEANLTVEELARRPEVTTGIQLFSEGTQLTVKHRPAEAVGQLLETVASGDPLRQICAQVSRNLLGGVRLPAPVSGLNGVVSAEGELTGLAELAGWQLPAPPPSQSSLTVTVTPSGPPQSWLVLPEGGLTFSYTAAELEAAYPAPTLGRVPVSEAKPIPLSGVVPRTYGLDHKIALQAAPPLAIPGSPTGSPSLWRFPAALIARARQQPQDVYYDILRSTAPGTPADQHDLVEVSTFATLVPVTIRRVEGLEHVYELIGADTADRELLLELAFEPGIPETPTQAYLGTAPAPGAHDPSGLALLDASGSRTFVIRANMATDVPLPNPPEGRIATLDNPTRFLRMLWEGSVAESGYYLGFSTAEGQDLPAGAFGNDGTATLWLLAVLSQQQTPPVDGRRLLRTDNCALIGDGLASAAHALYVEARDAHLHPSELASQALVPSGSAGVTLTVPPPEEPESAAKRLEERLSLLVAKIDGTYRAVKATPAAPPQAGSQNQEPLWRRQRLKRLRGAPTDPADQWRYDKVVQLSAFGPSSQAPDVDGLPKPPSDPYRGFGDAEDLAHAKFTLGYADVLGNVSELAKEVDVPLGYIDPLLGPGTWPGATTSLGVAREGNLVRLTATVASQPGAAAPAPGQKTQEATEAAEQQAKRYEEAYFQLAQTETVSGWLATTLRQNAAGNPEPVEITEGIAPLWRFTASSYLYAQAVASLRAPSLAGIGTLRALEEKLGVTPASFAAANGDRPFSHLALPQDLTVTPHLTALENDSAKTLAERAAKIADGPRPSASQLLQISENTALPLRAGTVFALPTEVPLTLPADTDELTLASVAGEHRTTPAQLAIDSAALVVLRREFSFEAGGHLVEVGEETPSGAVVAGSFEAVRDRFEELGVSLAIAELATAAQKAKGIFVDSAQLKLAKVVAAPPSAAKAPPTLRWLAEGGPATLQELAEANVELANLFPLGTPVSLGTEWPAANKPVVPSGSETLNQYAMRYGSTAPGVLAENPGLELNEKRIAESPPDLFGLAVLPDAPPLVPYTLSAGDSLSILRTVLGSTPAELAKANAEMPGILAPNQPVSVVHDGTPYNTTTLPEGDTLAKVTARLQAKAPAITLGEVAEAIAAEATILVPGGLLAVPAPPLAAREGQPAALTQAQVEAAYGIDAPSFAQANAMLPGLLPKGISLAIPPSGPAPEREGRSDAEVTKSEDSFNAVLNRLAERGIQTDLPSLLAANSSLALFVAGKRVLLPPKRVSVSAPIGDGNGPFHDPVFPLSVTLRLQRQSATVLRKDDEVERSDTPVPAPVTSQGEESKTFHDFVTNFQRAMPGLRLGTARVEDTPADLWVVDFTAHGIASVAVKPSVEYPDTDGGEMTDHPRFLALRPLYPLLWNRSKVLIPTLNRDTGALEESKTTPMDFQGIDVEVWARGLLSDLDLFLSASYAAAIQAEGLSTALSELLGARWKLAKALAQGLNSVLAVDDPGAQAGRAAAREDFARLAGSGLLAAYDVCTVLQFDASVRSAYTPESQRGLLPAALVGGAQPVPQLRDESSQPEYSLTRDATRLDSPSSYVSFAMTLPDPSHHKNLRMEPLEYAYDTVQFQISAVTGGEGYVDSDWVSLVHPLTGSDRPANVSGDLGTPVVPIPLRTHPAVPVLLGQTATATHAENESPTLAEAAQWTFGLTYSHEHAEQDDVLLTLTFNVLSPPLRATEATDDLATRLAKYAVLGDELRELMSWYVEPPSPAPATLPAVRQNIAASVATLVEGIADAWLGFWPSNDEDEAVPPALQTDVPDGDSYHFRVNVEVADVAGGGSALQKVVLTLDSPTTRPGPTGEWPTVSIRGADGEYIELFGISTSDSEREYIPLLGSPPIAIEGWPALRLEWAGLNVASVANARATLSARRNERLLPVAQTNRAFVLDSASVTAPDVATPMLEWNHDFSLSGASLREALAEALGELFGDASEPLLTVGVSYGHRLVEPVPGNEESGLTSVLPCLLYPHQPLSSDIPTAIEDAVTSWQETHRPSPAGGEWLLFLSLTSWLDQQTPRPLLTLDQLVYPLRLSADPESGDGAPRTRT